MSIRLGRADRAKQFMPFAALSGFEDVIRDAGRSSTEQICLGADAAEALDACLRSLRIGDRIAVIYYDGKNYRERSGVLCKVDLLERCLLLDGFPIPIDNLLTAEKQLL